MELTEDQFWHQVTELASLLGWHWLHIRKSATGTRGAGGRMMWRTPVAGPLGKGWPDLVLMRKGRTIFAELKSEKGKTSGDQDSVLAFLVDMGFDVYVWRPSDIEQIAELLR